MCFRSWRRIQSSGLGGRQTLTLRNVQSHWSDDLKILIPLKGLVDVDEELSRLNRQLEKEKAELAQIRGKLGNSRFVDNAPSRGRAGT